MANASAWGFSGYDPWGSTLEGSINTGFSQLNNHFNSKRFKKDSQALAAYNAALEYSYAQKYALNSPSWLRAGYENAGFNPILVATQGLGGLGSMSPSGSGFSGLTSGMPSNSSNEFDNEKFVASKLALKQAKANIYATESSADNQKNQGEAAKINAETNQWQIYDARHEGYAGYRVAFLGVKNAAGAKGEIGLVTSVRINKVTGEVYDVYSGKRVRILEEVGSSSAKPPEDSNSRNDSLKAPRTRPAYPSDWSP